MKNVIIYIWLMLLTVFVAVFLVKNSPKIRYIEMDRVFNAFDMKIELEKNYRNQLNSSQKELELVTYKAVDLENRFKVNPSKMLADSLNMMTSYIDQQTKKIEEISGNLKFEYDGQIQTRLMQYILEFREKEGLDVLLTSIDRSTVVAGSDAFNSSEELIEFINSKYAGNEN
jgi:Skp family chaperone for outer membrane proteins